MVTKRRILPGPFWTMLAAVWALVLLGGAPWQQGDMLCGAGGHPAPRTDCVACCPCTAAGPVQAMLADAPALPSPRGTSFAMPATARNNAPAPVPRLPARARGPPKAA